MALCHKSAARESIKGLRLSNERLEYLGDAVLGLIIADYLLRKYPYKDEGFLTEVRARIVNRSHLNKLGLKLGLDNYIVSEINGHHAKSLYGNALEALVGAVYIDKGYKSTKRIVLERIIESHTDIDRLVHENNNYKSQLVEWSQKEKVPVEFRVVSEKETRIGKLYKVDVLIKEKVVGSGEDKTIKGAEQIASEKALIKVNNN
ncbi:MAG: ribonuclease III [Bacteroidales bacterium]|nr:ribonuclease III [Bacteroidales bacterium]